jgi:uncharacterized protein
VRIPDDIPGDEAILALHERHAPSPAALGLVWTHCQIVCAIAGQLLARPGPALDGIDAQLVRAGCLLHDIGVYRLYDEHGRLDDAGYVRHGVLGHELLAADGLPDALCRFASHHTGAGISAADVISQGLPLPPGDYLAGTPEERLVMYADKFHSKSAPPHLNAPASAAAGLARFGAAKAAAFAAMRADYGDPDLPALSEAWGHSIL